MDSIITKERRLAYFDVVKGFTIIMVIIIHSGCSNPFTRLYASYFMPLFFIISGYFFKLKPIKQTIFDNIKALLPPYLFAGIIGILLNFCKAKLIGFSTEYIYDYILLFFFGPIVPIGNGVNVLWFFATLFWGRIIFVFLNKYMDELNVFLSSVFIFICNYILFSKGVNLSYFHIDKAFYCLFFLSVGSLCRKYTIFNYKIPLYAILIIIFSLSFKRPIIDMSVPHFGNLITDAIIASLLSILTIHVFKNLEQVNNKVVSYFFEQLSIVGRHTLMIYSIECVVFIFGFQQLLQKMPGYFGVHISVSSIWKIINVLSRLFCVLSFSWVMVKLLETYKRINSKV